MVLRATPARSNGFRPHLSTRNPVMGPEMRRARALVEKTKTTRKTGTPKDAAKRGLARCMAPIPTLQKKNVEKRGSPCRLKTLNRNNPPRWKAGLDPPSAVSCAHCFVCSYSSRSGPLLQVKRLAWEHLRPGTGGESLSLAFHNCPAGRLSRHKELLAADQRRRKMAKSIAQSA